MNHNYLVTVQEPVQTQDPLTGEVSVTWSDVLQDVSCDIQDVSVNQFLAAQAIQGELQANIIFPILPGLTLTKDMRFVCSTPPYDGAVFNPVGGFLRDKKTGYYYYTIPCSQGVNDGDV